MVSVLLKEDSIADLPVARSFITHSTLFRRLGFQKRR
jgi:hypothetical protein